MQCAESAQQVGKATGGVRFLYACAAVRLTVKILLAIPSIRHGSAAMGIDIRATCARSELRPTPNASTHGVIIV